jgi:hypothetical protein
VTEICAVYCNGRSKNKKRERYKETWECSKKEGKEVTIEDNKKGGMKKQRKVYGKEQKRRLEVVKADVCRRKEHTARTRGRWKEDSKVNEF